MAETKGGDRADHRPSEIGQPEGSESPQGERWGPHQRNPGRVRIQPEDALRSFFAFIFSSLLVHHSEADAGTSWKFLAPVAA